MASQRSLKFRYHDRFQRFRLQDLHLIAPRKKMPGELTKAASTKADDDRPIGLRLDDLGPLQSLSPMTPVQSLQSCMITGSLRAAAIVGLASPSKANSAKRWKVWSLFREGSSAPTLG